MCLRGLKNEDSSKLMYNMRTTDLFNFFIGPVVVEGNILKKKLWKMMAQTLCSRASKINVKMAQKRHSHRSNTTLTPPQHIRLNKFGAQ